MKNKNNKKIIIIISIILVILIVALIIIQLIIKKHNNQQKLVEQVKAYSSLEDFKTIEEVAAYLECKLKKQENSKAENYKTDIYMEIKYKPVTETESYKGFYDQLISYSANALQYQNFRIIDLKNEITIEVICDEESKKVKGIAINGETNYFEKYNSYKDIKNIEETKITNFEIQSEILKKLIDENWNKNQINFGTKESSFEKYDIYFDEGIKIREISGKVFNIIFTEKYNDKIVNNIKTTNSKDEIIKILGKPTFEDENTQIIGYKGKNIYLFYNSNKEISIYKVENDFDSSEFAKMVDEYLENKDELKFVQNVKNNYTDYDQYENSSIGTTLQYTLKGILVEFRKGKSKGVKIYNNYNGIIFKDINIEKLKENTSLPDNLFIINEDLVVKHEIERISNRNVKIRKLNLEDSSDSTLTKSNKFYLVKETISGGAYKIRFISKDGENPDTELKENIDYYIWIDDYNFVYSIKNKGIYLYNLKQRKYAKLIEATNEEFKIIEYKDNVLKYDDKNIVLKKN